MKWTLITNALYLLFKRIDKEDVDEAIALAWNHIEPGLDKILDHFEDKYKGNALVEHACKLVRDVCKIEDND